MAKRRALIAIAALVVAGQGEGGAGGSEPPRAPARRMPTHGGAVAITADQAYAVTADRNAGRVTVSALRPGAASPRSRRVDLDVGPGSEPWAVVIGGDDDSAYVILRNDQRVLRIRDLRGSPSLDPRRARTGAEPTGLALSPSGARLYVANWAEGTVSVVDTGTMSVAATVDLNAALAGSGALGSGVEPRPGLAHPRAVAVTDDGDADDGDETVYVTEFFSQAPKRDLPPGDSRLDAGRRALVYWFDAGDGALGEPIAIDPVADTRLSDRTGERMGCFPNQLHAAAIAYGAAQLAPPHARRRAWGPRVGREVSRGVRDPLRVPSTIDRGRLYVTSLCEFRQASASRAPAQEAMFVVDLATNREVIAQRVLLTRAPDRAAQPRTEPSPGNVSSDGNEAAGLLGMSVSPAAVGFPEDRRAPIPSVLIK